MSPIGDLAVLLSTTAEDRFRATYGRDPDRASWVDARELDVLRVHLRRDTDEALRAAAGDFIRVARLAHGINDQHRAGKEVPVGVWLALDASLPALFGDAAAGPATCPCCGPLDYNEVVEEPDTGERFCNLCGGDLPAEAAVDAGS